MKKLFNGLSARVFGVFVLLTSFQTMLLAQDPKVEINGNDVGSWFGRNWAWIAGALVILLLIVLFGRSSSRRTVESTKVADGYGSTRRTTVTEE